MLEYTETYRSPVNSSKSKQLYSFPKESRFKFQKLDTSFMSHKLYNLPNLNHGRAPGFGYGKRQLIFPNSQRDAPSPTAYTIASDIDCDRMSKRGLSMSRKLNSDSYLRKSKELPGPGQYNTLGNQLSRPGIKFNQQKKMFEYPVNMRTDPAIPGPAAYSEHAAANGKSCLAKYRNSSVCKFGSEKRTSRSSVSPTPSPLEYQRDKIVSSYISSHFRHKEPVNFSGYSARKEKPRQPVPSPASQQPMSQRSYIFSEFAVKEKPYKIKANPGLIDYRLRNLTACTKRVSKKNSQERLPTEPSRHH